MSGNELEIKQVPAEKIESKVAVMEANGEPVTDTAGKPIAEPIAMETKPTEPSFAEKLAQLMRDSGFSEEAINGKVGEIEKDLKAEERKATRANLLLQKEADTKKLLAVHAELVAAIAPIIEKAGIKLDIPGKQIVYHVGDAGSPCWDIAYPEPLPDKAKTSTNNGGIKVRKAVVMGNVHLRIPELSMNMKVAESLSALYTYFRPEINPKTGKPFGNQGFASATAAILNLGDGSEGKAGQDGVFKVQNVPAIPETVGNLGSKAYNILTLSDKGYTFFQIAKGKVAAPVAVATAAPIAPVAEAPKATIVAATPAVATAPVASSLPENLKTMSKPERRAWRAKNEGNVLSS